MRRNRAFRRSGMNGRTRKVLRTRQIPARVWRAQALGVAPTETLKVRRQTAAAGKNDCASLTRSLTVNDLDVEEEELATMTTWLWAEWGLGRRSSEKRGGGRFLKCKDGGRSEVRLKRIIVILRTWGSHGRSGTLCCSMKSGWWT